jgi:radical SAM superfamily enzyme YgiQ (UPF0313 family)
MSRILLILPPYRDIIYSKGKTRVGVPGSPNLTLAVLAGSLLKKGHEVKILDLDLEQRGIEENNFIQILKDFLPEYVGITSNTPTFFQMVKVARLVKKYNDKIKIIGGGPHISSLPEESLRNSPLDIVVIGEGDFVLPRIAENAPLGSIPGIAFKENGKITCNPPNKPIQALDSLAFPAWHLYTIEKYKTPRLMCRKNPVGWIETSRGCTFNCSYCTKSVFGRTFRVKSPKRVVDEIEYMLKIGFKEIHIADDMFTTDINRVKLICDEIISRKLKFPWATVTGIRVDRADNEMLKKMSNAGCYRVYFGIESGNQNIIDIIGKKITLEQVRNIVKLSEKNGMETCGFFMLALPGETEETMQDTIDFACELGLDFAKTTITTPLPSTPLFDELEKEGRIKTKDWSKYNLYQPANQIYDHSNLNWETAEKYYNKFYRRFYFRPNFIIRKFIKGVIQRTLFLDLYYMLKTKW